MRLLSTGKQHIQPVHQFGREAAGMQAGTLRISRIQASAFSKAGRARLRSARR